MTAVRHGCRRCGRVLSDDRIDTASFVPCPQCGDQLLIREYPAARVEQINQAGSPSVEREETQAGCFYHPGRTAEVVCDGCGRFICGLCVVDFKSQRLCPNCLRQQVEEKEEGVIVRRFIRYDRIALLTAILPIFFWPMTFVTGPASVYMGVRYWKRPVSLVTSGRGRLALAILLGGLQTLGWLAVIVWGLSRWLA